MRISVGGGKLTEPTTSYTDTQGVGQIANLAPGRYSLSLEKAGYFPQARGASSGYPAIDVAAESPGDVDAGDIVFTRMRAISGRVTWENGDPAEHVIAHALLVRRNRAEFRPGDSLLSPANEHGDFRIGNLKPGRYVVYSYTMGMASESASDPIALPVFYPGSPSPEIGAAVDLRTTDEVSHISMILRESEGVSVEGTFVASAALPEGSTAQVALMIVVSSTSPNVRSFQTLRVDGPIEGLKVSAGELQPVVGTIRYDEPVAAPVSRSLDGVTVWLACPDLQLFGIAATRTDKEGKFNAGTFPGLNYLLTITPPRMSIRKERNWTVLRSR